jgi:DHA1 family bicyclomycin/chloramphenicol resistance-like MFS transporter
MVFLSFKFYNYNEFVRADEPLIIGGKIINMQSQPRMASAEISHPLTKVSMAMIVALGLMMAFGPLSMDMYLPAFPEIETEFGTSASLVQISLTACIVGLALGQLIAGPISDQTGRRRPLIAGLALYVISSLLCAWVPSIEAFIVMRFIQGLSGAAGIVISRAITRDLFTGPALTKFMASLTIVFGAAPILSPIIGGQLMQFMNWQGIFYVLAGIGGLLLLYSLFGLAETLPPESRTSGGLARTRRDIATLIRDRFFVGLALSQGLAVACMFIYIASSSFVLQNNYGLSPNVFGLIFGINALGQIVLSQITGRLAGRVSERKLYVTGVLIIALGASLVLLNAIVNAGLWLLLIGFFIPVAFLGMVLATSFPLAMEQYGHAAGSASAIIGVLTFLIGGILAPLGGLGGSETELPMGLMMAGTAWAACAVYWWLIARSPAKSRASAPNAE